MKHLLKSGMFIAALLTAEFSFAWGVTGHRVVAEIAERNLNKKALRGIHELIGKEGLAYWANWPDFIKSDTTHTWDHTSKWHYVDLPGHIGKEVFITDLQKLPGENLYTQIKALTAELKDKTLPVEKRKNALVFLIHLVGDLHQPLHVGRDEDQGGNKISVNWFDKKTSLHSLWDGTLVDFQQYSFKEYADALNILSKDEIKTMQQTSLEDWFYESHVLSDKVYEQSPPDAKLSYKYNYIFKKDLEDQLLKGGVQLAGILNGVFE